MVSMWRLRGITWGALARRVWHELREDDVFGQAAKLSFYFLLALFPLLLLLTTLFGYFAQRDELRTGMLEYFRTVVPRSAYQLVVDTLNQISAGAGKGKLSIGLLATVWAASNGMAAIADGLNRAYEVEDRRPWWKTQLLALGLTIASSIFVLSALGLTLAGNRIGAFLASRLGLQTSFQLAWDVARWPIAFFIVLIAFNLLYRFAPDLKDWHWKWSTPGAVVAVVLWITASAGFRLYLRYFNSYNASYGSLGAVIILLLWFYLTSLAILIGAEVNSEIENAAARSGDSEARLPGERRPGDRARQAAVELRSTAGGM